jgi:hypothetical protein
MSRMSELSVDLGHAVETARVLAENLAGDIELAKTREEHIRVTARANEAGTLALALEYLVSELAGVQLV